MKCGNFLSSSCISVLTVLMLVGCGPDESSRLLMQNDEAISPMFFLVGGRASCKADGGSSTPNPNGSGIFKALKRIMTRLETDDGAKSEYFSSCHRNSVDMAYTSSWDSSVKTMVAEEEVRAQILAKRAEIDPRRIIIVGHSYGAWIAMSMIGETQESIPVGQLFTIDPISKRNCSFSKPSGCKSAPTDIVAESRMRIADHSEGWHNYYQTRTSYLHSSPIDEADGNYKLNYPHVDIDQAPEAWEGVYNHAKAMVQSQVQSRFF